MWMCVWVCSSVCSDTEIIPHRNDREKVHKPTGSSTSARSLEHLRDPLSLFSLVLSVYLPFGFDFNQKITFSGLFSFDAQHFQLQIFRDCFSLTEYLLDLRERICSLFCFQLKNVAILNSWFWIRMYIVQHALYIAPNSVSGHTRKTNDV